MPKILKIALPAGIGDNLWIMTKIQSLLEQENADKVSFTVTRDPLKRSADFLRSFSFTENVNYCEYDILEQPVVLGNGCYNYTNTQRNWQNKFDWFCQSNRWLEHGNRLEDWMPEWKINWNVMKDCYQIKDHEKKVASALKKPYCVFYLGPESGNTVCGHNCGPLWTPNNWLELGKLCKEDAGLNVIIVGATWDESYFQKYFSHMDFDCANLIGCTSINETISILKEAKFVIGYQSGIVIMCPFLNIKAGGFWRPYGNSISPDYFISFNERMAHGWVNPEILERGDWLPLIYGKCSPLSIFTYIKEKWL